MKPLRALVVGAISAIALLVPATGDGPAAVALEPTDGVALEIVASGLSLAVDLTAPPGDDRLFIVEKVGRIRIVENGTLLATPFLDITGPVLSSGFEQGLLGLAFPDDYVDSGKFYVSYTSDAGGGDTAVAEYTVSGSRNVADVSSGRVLLTVDQPFANHNGGSIQVGPDGYLYVGLGDGGGGGDPGDNGQDKSTLLGSILRLDPATGDAAAGNPFIGVAGADKIWAWGLRNPWRFSFDPSTGEIYVADVGQEELEEIDILPAGVGGLNLGWDAYEGTDCFAGPCSPGGKVFPVHEYGHRAGGACGGSITGGYVYRGNSMPWLRGQYFYADWCLGDLASFRVKGGQPVDQIDWTQSLAVPGFITSFGTDGFGELYFLAQGNVYKFVPTRSPDCDFDGDGYGDVAVGVPGENHSSAKDAGTVMEFPGSETGVDIERDATWRQGESGVAGPAADFNMFGSAVACGDFDGDGSGDLAIGAPGRGGGTVSVLYGSPGGLSGSGSDSWNQASLGVGTSVDGDTFGASLAAGDVNRDGYDDLVIGDPDDNEAGPARSGSVTAILGGPGGLDQGTAVLVHQDTDGIRDSAEEGDRFGQAVAVGDVDGDGFFDLIVGAPGERVGGNEGAGAVAVIFGKPQGLGTRDLFIHRDRPGIKGASVTDAAFGSSLAVGTLDNDGYDDIVIGVSRADKAGAVQVIYGDVGGPAKRDAVFRQGAGGISGTREPGDEFGSVLAVGDANGDGFDEVAAGAPREKHNGATNAGMVGVIPGSVSGLDASGYQRWHQAVSGIKGAVAVDDYFGAALRFIDTRGDGRADLVIGSPQVAAGGDVALIPGKAGGLSGTGDLLWSQDTPGVLGNKESNDRFGAAL